MPRPKYLPPPPLEVTLCRDCEHCPPPKAVVRVRDKKRYTTICSLHGNWIGLESATCEDGTNKKRFGKQPTKPLRSETGWEDY
jgi:hypothetical protein